MKKYTLEKKMRNSFIFVFTVIFLVMMLIMAGIIRKVYWKKSYHLCEQLVSLNLTLLNSQIMDIQRTQEVLVNDISVRKAVSCYSGATQNNYQDELVHRRNLDEVFYLLERNESIRSAYIINTEGTCIYAYIQSLKTDCNMLEEKWFTELLGRVKMNTCYISDVHGRSYLVNDKGEQCVSIVVPIQSRPAYEFRADAYLVCDIDLDHILYGSADGNDMKFSLIDGNGYLYSAEMLGLTEQDAELVISRLDDEETQVLLMKKGWPDERIIVARKSKLYGWKVIGIKSLKEIQAMDSALFIIFILTAFASIMVIVIMARKISRSMLNPMNRLIETCNLVSAGNYDVDFPDAPSEEITILSHTVDSMLRSVNHLSAQVVEEEKILAREKLKALQHQINPHFLNNVLQTIKAMAVEGENEKISHITTLLGKFLSYSVYRPYENVELEEELNYLGTYIEIQNIRYNNNIFYSVSCEPEIISVPIPKLTLQPIVENSIEHGYDGNEKLIIDITAERDKKVIEIVIHDNGKGIKAEEFHSIQESLKAGEACIKRKSIGILNVNERLKKMYGADYGVELAEHVGNGTTVIIRIPAGGRNQDVQGVIG